MKLPEFLEKKYGPLKGWQIAVLGIGAATAYLWWRSRNSAASAGSAATNTAGTTANTTGGTGGGIPVFSAPGQPLQCPAGYTPDPTGTFCIASSASTLINNGPVTMPGTVANSSQPAIGATAASLYGTQPVPYNAAPATNNPLGIPVSNPNIAQVFNGTSWVPTSQAQQPAAAQPVSGTPGYFNGAPIGQLAQYLANAQAVATQNAQNAATQYFSNYSSQPSYGLGLQGPAPAFLQNPSQGIFSAIYGYTAPGSLGGYLNPVPYQAGTAQSGLIGPTMASALPGVTGHYVTYANGESVWVND